METDNCPRLDCFCDGSCTLDTQFPRVWRNCTVTNSQLGQQLFGFPLVSRLRIFCDSVSSGILPRYELGDQISAALAFTIYLTHKMTNHWVNTHLPDYIVLSPEQTFFAALLAAILSALLLHLAVEKPFLLLRDWITSLFAANPSEKP